jgi:uncharacterized protein DUF11
MFRLAISRSLAVMLIAALGLLFLQPTGAGAAGTLTLNPTSGPAGTVVGVTGSGYGNTQPVTVSFNGTPFVTVTSSSTGDISFSFVAPHVAPNTYTVSASGGGASGSAQFTITNQTSPVITLTPTGGPAGTQVTVHGAAFGANQTGTIYFNGTSVGTFTTDNTGAINNGATFTVPNIANGSYTVTAATATRSASAQFTVGPAIAGFSLSKFVTVNGLGYNTTGVAQPGASLTYDIQVSNATGAALNGVTVTDTLQPGQGFVNVYGATCTNPSGTTLSCTVGTVNNGTTVHVFINTIVLPTFTSGQITNQATATSTTGPSAASNTTVVYVGSGVPMGANFEICGPVTAYSAAGAANGSITVSGVTLVITAGSSAAGVVPGANECVLATVNGSGQLTAVAAGSNLSNVNVACGIYTPAASGYVNVAGIPLAVLPGTTFVAGLTAGASYCFILNSSGQAIGAVVGYPTAAILPAHHHPYRWMRAVRAFDYAFDL